MSAATGAPAVSEERDLMHCTCDDVAAGHSGLSPVCLAHLWLFQHPSGEEAAALAAAAWRKPFDKGQYVVIEGQPATLLFLIKAGRVKLAKTDDDGTEILVDMRKAGDFIGETFLSADAESPFTAEAAEDSLLCGFTRERFERLVSDHPKIGLQVMRNMSERISWLTSRVGGVSSTRLDERLYAVLVTLAREHGTKTDDGLVIEFPLTHEELSSLVGAHRVSVTRALKTLRESGKVVREGRRLILPVG